MRHLPEPWRGRAHGALHALAWGGASLVLGLVRFEIPGVAAGAIDLREIGVLLSVFYLRHWSYLLVVAIVTSLATTPVASFAVCVAMHAIAAPAAWFGYQALRRRGFQQARLGVAWALVTTGYYVGLLLPAMVTACAVVGLIAWEQVAATYRQLLASIPYELATTAAVTSIYVVTLGERARRRDAEDALRRNEAQLKAILASVPVGVARVSNRTLVWANDQLARFTGRAPSELVSMDLAQLVDDPAAVERIGRGEVSGGELLRVVRRDGEPVPALLAAAPLATADRPSDVVLSVLDISERVRLEAQLRNAAKLELLGQLSGGVAHDFNNLLTVVTMQLRTMRRGQDAARDRNLDLIQTAVDRGAALIRQLLDFGRRESSQPCAIALQDIVPSTLALIRPLLGGGVEIDVDVAADTPAVLADPVEIEQVIMNLLVNARDALEETSCPRIIVRAHAQGEGAGRAAVLSIADTGAGMDAATRERIFEPFFTTKGDGKGSGLGLATVQRIVDRYQGHIDVESAPGAGTTFHVHFPAHAKGNEVAGE